MSMTYYTLGRSGLRVSRLALGTMTFGTEWGWEAERDTAQAVFDAYVDAAEPGGAGRLDALRGSRNPGFRKFTAATGRSSRSSRRWRASSAAAWRRWRSAGWRAGPASPPPSSAPPGPRSFRTLAALDFAIPPELRARLDTVSAPAAPFPYSFFGPEIQGGITGGAAVGNKPEGYAPPRLTAGSFAGVG
jgi:hypothetical protein